MGGIFLIHGITKTPAELEKLAFYFRKYGFKVCCPLLPGHGTGKNGETYFHDLWKTSNERWLIYAEKEFLKFKKECKKIYVGGISLGGNIAISLAAKHKVDGLLLIGTPIYLSRVLAITCKVGEFLIRIDRKIREKGFHGLPLKRLLDIKSFFIEKSKKELSNINCPLIIFHSKRDDIAHPRSAFYIYKKTNTRNKKIFFLDNIAHGLDLKNSKDAKFIVNTTCEFFKI